MTNSSITEAALRNLVCEAGFEDIETPEAEANAGSQGGWLVTLGNHNQEWLVYADYDAAEQAAVSYVTEQLGEEPELFTQSWLEGYLTMSPMDIRITAGEAGDRAGEDLDNDDAIEQADLRREMEDSLEVWETAQEDAESAMDAAQAVLDAAEDDLAEDSGDDSDVEDAEAAEAAASVALSAAEDEEVAAQEALDTATDAAAESYGEQAREQISESVTEETEVALESDPVGYFEDHYGWTAAECLKNGTLRINVEAAAEDAVNTDGVAHFLSSYDFNMVELEDGAVAFRIN